MKMNKKGRFFKCHSARLTENSSFCFLFSVCTVLMDGILDVMYRTFVGQ